MSRDPLDLDRETMRQLGYATVDMLLDWLEADVPPLRRTTPKEMQARLSGLPPDDPGEFGELLATLREDVLPFGSRVQHPAFFAFIPGSATWPGALGDFIASAANVYAGSWMESAGVTQVELEVLRWFSSWLGYPESASGILVSGGSAANMTALAAARETLVGPMRPDLVLYASSEAHHSIVRGARTLGFRPGQIRILPVSRDFRLEPRTLAEAIDADLAAGLRPLFVSASAGTTSTGSVDPLRELADVAAERGVWFHVDAAYGGFAVLTARGAQKLEGIELADSITLDPHKWLYQPYECGCLLLREGDQLQAAFEMRPEYLRDSEAEREEVNFSDRGLQLTRTSRALKLWLSLHYFGADAFRRAIDRSLDLIELAERRIEESEQLELLSSPTLGILTFRRRFPGESEREHARLNDLLVDALERSGLGLVSSTRLDGRYAIRLCPLNHTSRPEDVLRVLEFIETADPALGRQRPTYDRDDGGRLRLPEIDPAFLARLPLFEGLDAAELDRLVTLAYVRDAAAGERIVERWEPSRDFCVVLRGSADVFVRGERVRELGAGDFFGEMALLEWAGGSGRSRLATVVAREPVRMLVFPPGAIPGLVREFPVVEAEVARASGQSLQV
jgi:glutamate/tyrosine decarboxylase-like PLP-dependent enzyme